MPRPLVSPTLQAVLAEIAHRKAEILRRDEELSCLKAYTKDLEENVLTEVVGADNVQHSGVALPDGTEISFERTMHCTIRKDDRPAAYDWLNRHNVGAILKNQITISFPKDSIESARLVREMIARVLPEYQIGLRVGKAPETIIIAVREILRAAGLLDLVTIEQTQELPGATLAAFVRKSIASGITLPPFFSVYAPLLALAECPWRPEVYHNWYQGACTHCGEKDPSTVMWASQELLNTAMAEICPKNPARATQVKEHKKTCNLAHTNLVG